MNMLRCALLSLLMVPAAAQAAAGEVLFALGRVEVQRGDTTFPAARGTPVEVGDVLSTGPTGLTQVRMKDGALLSLRYGSTLQVEDFRLPEPAAAPVAQGPVPVAPSAPSGGRSVMRLLRGAFRTVTGLIGHGANDEYSVVTPVATIGIRGTDYSAAYCSGDCGETPDGLYVGVSNGGVDVRNDGGTLALGDDEYGYVRDDRTAPERELVPPDVLDRTAPPEGDTGDGGRDGAVVEGRDAIDVAIRDITGADGTLSTSTRPEGTYEVRPASGHVAFSADKLNDAIDASVLTADRGELLGFTGSIGTPVNIGSIGTARNVEFGFDSATGLYWGRWSGGIANVGGAPVPLAGTSLHWIYADGGSTPVLAITGSRTYTLVGGTTPTNNAGAVGTLGTATLSADFTNLVVNTSVDVSFLDPASGGSIQWVASGQGAIAGGAFLGSYSSVSVGGQLGGSGSFAGFFTGDAGGAGLSYELVDLDFVTTVSGALAFADAAGGATGP